MYGKRSGSIRLILGSFGMKINGLIWRRRDPFAFRTPRMVLEQDECFPNINVGVRIACGKSSGYSISIRRVPKAFEKHTEKTYSVARSASFEKIHNFRIFKVNINRSGQCDHTISPNAFRLLSECFQYAFRIDRILPEYRILPAYWFRKVSFANAFRMLSECFLNTAQNLF